jgi:AcrR family transcriptional regulator
VSPQTQQERREATRGRIVQAARELVVERGYDAVSTSDVLDRAGVSRGALYHHFDSRQALLAAVLEALELDIIGQLGAAASGAPDPLSALQLGMQWYLDESLRSVELQRVGILEGRKALGWEAWRATISPHGLTLLTQTLQAGMDTGHVRAMDPEPLAYMLLAALHECCGLILTAADQEAERASVGEALAALIDGLRAA